jgi:predicted small integral membrane protein
MLPRMTTGDWLFWAIIVWIGVHLLWLGFLPESLVWIGTIIATVLGFLTFKYGPRPKEEVGAEE